jgi:hypothetical protein
MAYRGVTLSQLASGTIVRSSYISKTHCSGIDFTGKFNASWDEDRAMFAIPDIKTRHHVMMIFNAYNDKNYEIIKRYDELEFDWEHVLFV